MRYAFGEFELVPGQMLLLQRGVPLPARKKVVALLEDLIERRGRIVYKNELLARLWPDVHVGPTSLSTLVGEARALIGDTGQRQAWIRTQPGRGYRFVGSVRFLLDFGEPAGPASLGQLDLGQGRLNPILRFETHLDLLSKGRPRVLALTGGPGSGKRRLARELMSMARGRTFTTASGLCPEEADSPTLWPWVEILRCLLQEAEAEQLSPLIGPDLLGLVRCQPGVLGWLSAKDPETRGRTRFGVFDSIRRFLVDQARRRPCVIALEHLERADRETLALVDHLVAHLDETPMMLVCTLPPAGEPFTNPYRQIFHRFRESTICEIIPMPPPGITGHTEAGPIPGARGPHSVSRWEIPPLDSGRSFPRYSTRPPFEQGSNEP